MNSKQLGLRVLLLALLAAVPWAVADTSVTNPPGVGLYDEGTRQGQVQRLDCVGAAIACTKSATMGTLSITSTGAPTDATYLTQTVNGSLSAEQALGALSSGCLSVTTVTGVVASTGVACVTPSTTDTFTNKTYDAEGTGNVLTAPAKVWFPAAGCNNTTSATMWDLPTASAPTVACVTGSNIQKGVLQYLDTTGETSAQNTLYLPNDYTGNLDVVVIWTTTATTGNVLWQVSTACTDVGGTATDDPSFNTVASAAVVAPGTASRVASTPLTNLTQTGCAASRLLHLKAARNGGHASDTVGATVNFLGLEVTLRRAM